MTKLLMEYAYEKKITLDLNESGLGNISNIPEKIIKLFIKYEKNVNFIYSKYDELLKTMDKMKRNIDHIQSKKEIDNYFKEIDNYFKENDRYSKI